MKHSQRLALETLFVSCLAVISVPSQAASSLYVPDNRHDLGAKNSMPFGSSKNHPLWTNQRYQILVPASYASNKPILIRDLGFASAVTSWNRFDQIKVSVGLTRAARLSDVFADNVRIRPAVLLRAKNYRWTWKASSWTRIGVQNPYLWIPQIGNLVIDIETRGAEAPLMFGMGCRTSLLIERKYAIAWTGPSPTKGNSSYDVHALKVELVTASADASVFGEGCLGSNGRPTMSYSGQPRLGGTVRTHVAQVRPRTVAISVLGFDRQSPRFPLDLTRVGAPGCSLFQSVDAVATRSTGNGSFTMSFVIPVSKAFVGVSFGQQFFIHEPKWNALHLASTNHGRVLIGS